MMKFSKTDIPSSIVVFLVALPLSIGIAMASGAPIQAGLVAAVVGGVVGGMLAGAPLQVSGPAAGLTVMVLQVVEKFTFENACTVFMLAGFIQLILGFAGFSRIALAIAPSVLHAMLAGIGVIITLSQFHVMMGSRPLSSPLQNLIHAPEAFLTSNGSAVVTGLLMLGILFLWNQKWMKKFAWFPGSLIGIIVTTLISKVLPDQPLITLSDSIFNGIHVPRLDGFPLGEWVTASIGLAIVASAESLLCAVATDRLHGGPKANLNRELVAQGVSNLLSGLLKGLPVTGVIVRSSANITAGAKSRWSAVFHGIWILLFSLLFSGVIKWIPLSALAALLIWIGVNLVKIHEIKTTLRFNEGAVYFATLLGVVFINLLWGIGIGVALSIFSLLYRLSKVEYSTAETLDGADILIRGSLSFLSVPYLMDRLDSIPSGKKITLKFELNQLDLASLDAIRSWKSSYEKKGGVVIKDSLDELWIKLMSKL